MNSLKITILSGLVLLAGIFNQSCTKTETRTTEKFCTSWKFFPGDIAGASLPEFNDSAWRELNLPHDWSIEGDFSADHPATPGGGALPGGIGWYRKVFQIPVKDSGCLFYIDFDGIYRNSEIWINGQSLGKRPNGYISFRYELTPYLKYGENKNVLSVKVDNSQQPNSRWYSGSGIYRNVWLVRTGKIAVDHWGTFITTPVVNESYATVSVETKIQNKSGVDEEIELKTIVVNPDGKKVGNVSESYKSKADSVLSIIQNIKISRPELWNIDKPVLYKVIHQIFVNGKKTDEYETSFGIRTFEFDVEKGFILNGKQLKILGVCNHHDLGCLGAAINTRAIERQLELLKEMGCNGIRTSHNPPAPELLDLCDKMGFIVMDEFSDIWKTGKNPYDYALYWDEWHERDLKDLVLRDRNHPSVFIWSIGNEVMEQWAKEDDSTGLFITKELSGIIRNLDDTRPITANWNDPYARNEMFTSDALDLMGYSYHLEEFEPFTGNYPGKKFIGSETTSALATRGSYDMPSDSIRRWPVRWDIPFTTGNVDYTCSAYDNCSAPWGSTHEETWKIIKKYDFLSGMYIWTGFDYLGEPTPYTWPARSSYFGILDLAGFPKDAYYMYQSEWTDKPTLHVFPHWNWNNGDTIDVWVYSNFDAVELFLNDQSLGKKSKQGDELHLSWRVTYSPGTIKAVATGSGMETMVKNVTTAGEPAKIELIADRTTIKADGEDLSFVQIKILDNNGNLVPKADNTVNFKISGAGYIAGVDNGNQVSHEPFKANYRKAFNGMCLAVIRSNGKKGNIVLEASSEGLEPYTISIQSR